jgi:hypothetical protein
VEEIGDCEEKSLTSGERERVDEWMQQVQEYMYGGLNGRDKQNDNANVQRELAGRYAFAKGWLDCEDVKDFVLDCCCCAVHLLGHYWACPTRHANSDYLGLPFGEFQGRNGQSVAEKLLLIGHFKTRTAQISCHCGWWF